MHIHRFMDLQESAAGSISFMNIFTCRKIPDQVCIRNVSSSNIMLYSYFSAFMYIIEDACHA